MTTSTVTDKGQTTVPQTVRDALGIKPRQQIQWMIQDDGTVLVRPQRSALPLFGSLLPKKKIPSRDIERQGTMDAIAKRVATKGSK
jgi:bifunctional DNA-binding transcriptional regulator/antitoxin component of YhaV-PrlF toxin-antitoxin module